MFYALKITESNTISAIACEAYATKEETEYKVFEFLAYQTNPSVLPTLDYYLGAVLDEHGNKVWGRDYRKPEPQPEAEPEQEEITE